MILINKKKAKTFRRLKLWKIGNNWIWGLLKMTLYEKNNQQTIKYQIVHQLGNKMTMSLLADRKLQRVCVIPFFPEFFVCRVIDEIPHWEFLLKTQDDCKYFPVYCFTGFCLPSSTLSYCSEFFSCPKCDHLNVFNIPQAIF